MRRLSRKSCSLQMNRRRIAFICKRLKKLSFNDWIRKRRNILKLSKTISISLIELLLGKILWLFRQELSRKRFRPFLPIFVFINNIQSTSLILNGSTKWILFINFGFTVWSLNRFHRFQNRIIFILRNHWNALTLVCIKHNIYAIWHSLRIGIHCHSLKIVCSIDSNTNLSITAFTNI